MDNKNRMGKPGGPGLVSRQGSEKIGRQSEGFRAAWTGQNEGRSDEKNPCNGPGHSRIPLAGKKMQPKRS